VDEKAITHNPKAVGKHKPIRQQQKQADPQ